MNFIQNCTERTRTFIQEYTPNRATVVESVETLALLTFSACAVYSLYEIYSETPRPCRPSIDFDLNVVTVQECPFGENGLPKIRILLSFAEYALHFPVSAASARSLNISSIVV